MTKPVDEYATDRAFDRFLGKIRQHCSQGPEPMSELRTLQSAIVFVKHRSNFLSPVDSMHLALFMFRFAIGILLKTGLTKEQISEFLQVNDKSIAIMTQIQDEIEI